MQIRDEEERERKLIEHERAKRASSEIPEEEESIYSSKRNSIARNSNSATFFPEEKASHIHTFKRNSHRSKRSIDKEELRNLSDEEFNKLLRGTICCCSDVLILLIAEEELKRESSLEKRSRDRSRERSRDRSVERSRERIPTTVSEREDETPSKNTFRRKRIDRNDINKEVSDMLNELRSISTKTIKPRPGVQRTPSHDYRPPRYPSSEKQVTPSRDRNGGTRSHRFHSPGKKRLC